MVRQAIARDGVERAGGTRAGRCFGADCVPAVRIDAIRLPPVRLPDVDVDPARLQRRRLSNDVDVLDGDGTTAYITPAGVLVDTDEAVVKPEADAALGEVAAKIADVPDAHIRIDGHTEDRADEAHNLDLSIRRAQAVAEWFTSRAGIDPDQAVR